MDILQDRTASIFRVEAKKETGKQQTNIDPEYLDSTVLRN
jgi:hypothetical protein